MVYQDLYFNELPSFIEKSLAKVFERQKNNDFDGAITSICGIIDCLTGDLYIKLNLGDHKKDDYQQRINKCFRTFKDSYILYLKKSGLDEKNANITWDNFKNSINAVGYVLASFRREFSDVHGIEYAENELILIAMNCATYILRSFMVLHPFIPKNHPINEIGESTRQYLTNCIARHIGRNNILNYPDTINDRFAEIGIAKSDQNNLFQMGIIEQEGKITEKGIEILKVIARDL